MPERSNDQSAEQAAEQDAAHAAETETASQEEASEPRDLIAEVQSLREERNALTGQSQDEQKEAELNEKISRLLADSTGAITEKLRSGEELSLQERLLLLHDIDERAERSAIAEMLLQRNGFKNFQEFLGKLNVKNIDVEGLKVALDKQHKNPWIKEHIKKLTTSGAISAATLGVISLLGGPISLAGLAGGLALGAGGRLVGEAIRHRQLAKDGFNDKVATDLLSEVRLMQTEAKKILENTQDDPNKRAQAINNLLVDVLRKEKLDSVVNYQKLEKRASKVKSALGLIGAVGGSLVGSALTRSADMVQALHEAKSEGVRIVHENGVAHLALDPSLGHEVHQTNDGVWRFMIEKKDIISAQERLGSDHWREWFHVVSQGGPEQGIVRAPDLQFLKAITEETGKSELFHLSEIDFSSVQAALGKKITYQTMLTLAGMGAASAGTEAGFSWQEHQKLKKSEIRLDDGALLKLAEYEATTGKPDKEKPTKKDAHKLSPERPKDLDYDAIVPKVARLHELSAVPDTDQTDEQKQEIAQIREWFRELLTRPAEDPLTHQPDYNKPGLFLGRDAMAIEQFLNGKLGERFGMTNDQLDALAIFFEREIWWKLLHGDDDEFTAAPEPQPVAPTPPADPAAPEAAKEVQEKKYPYGVTGATSELINDHAGADNILFRRDKGLYGVFDGLGSDGAPAASVAATAIEKVLADLDPNLSVGQVVGKVKEAFEQANETIRQEANGSKTTASVVRLWQEPGSSETKAVIGNIGDSRVYIFRADQGKLESITLDDGVFRYTDFEEVGGRVIPAGSLRSDEEARKAQTMLARANRQEDLPDELRKFHDPNIARYMTKNLGGSRPESPDIFTVPLSENDTLFLCSDGVHEALNETLIEWLLSSHTDKTNLAFDVEGFKAIVRKLTVDPGSEEFSSKGDDKSYILLSLSKGELSINYKSTVDINNIDMSILTDLWGYTDRERQLRKVLIEAKEARAAGNIRQAEYLENRTANSLSSEESKAEEKYIKRTNLSDKQKNDPEFIERLKVALALVSLQSGEGTVVNRLKQRLGM
ncbi:MAG: hypothetical protein WD688_19335 [Candidatus Binatia bacterium]